jgi:hypothetical protein
MKTKSRNLRGIGFLCLSALCAVAAGAQQKPNELRSAGYQPAREVNLIGTVLSFVADSQTGPLGAHAMVQTVSGLVDVHVGSAKFLETNGLKLSTGDSVRIIGESFTNGAKTVFLARIIQKGTLAVAVRSPQGMPLWPAGGRIANAKNQGGAL